MEYRALELIMSGVLSGPEEDLMQDCITNPTEVSDHIIGRIDALVTQRKVVFD